MQYFSRTSFRLGFRDCWINLDKKVAKDHTCELCAKRRGLLKKSKLLSDRHDERSNPDRNGFAAGLLHFVRDDELMKY